MVNVNLKLLKMNITMTYCPANITFTDIWVEHGMSKCFMDTVSIIVISSYLLIFGTIQLWMYRKYGSESNITLLPKNKLYIVQKFFLYLVPILSIVRIILQGTILDDNKIYGYMVMNVIQYLYIIILFKFGI